MATAEGREAFQRAAQALNDAGDRELRREVYAAFRKAGKPLGETVVAEGSAGMPRRGGLAARLAAAKVAQSNSTRGRNPGVALSLRAQPNAVGQRMDLKAIDELGLIRHPLFGDRHVWRVTKVAPGQYRRPFEAGREPVAREVIAAMERVGHQIKQRTEQGT